MLSMLENLKPVYLTEFNLRFLISFIYPFIYTFSVFSLNIGVTRRQRLRDKRVVSRLQSYNCFFFFFYRSGLGKRQAFSCHENQNKTEQKTQSPNKRIKSPNQ